MVGIIAIFVFFGAACGLVAGSWWGFSQNWTMSLLGAAGGVIGGGTIGALIGFISKEVPDLLKHYSTRHPVWGRLFLWCFWLGYLATVGAFWFVWLQFIRHMRNHAQ